MLTEKEDAEAEATQDQLKGSDSTDSTKDEEDNYTAGAFATYVISICVSSDENDHTNATVQDFQLFPPPRLWSESCRYHRCYWIWHCTGSHRIDLWQFDGILVQSLG